ncbi:helix-turn-helix domain-containing protein [Neisseria bacilliformis]|jgi:helix-turn-helix domain-containing protein|uniref:helix-turn-helix domain-containing protein n=1 Tax=Neisseria bacilliformis TaxID=267212 RepID=UPI000666CE78|nr:helix-turn-helix transcriptional regulator [Neisseria bacilliformis]
MKTHEKIRAIRELNQWSQEEMAEKLKMSVGGYAKIERGDSSVNLERLEQIAKIFNINVVELVQNDKGLIIQLNDEVNGDNNQISFYAASSDLAAEIEKLKLIITHKDELLVQKDRELAAKEEIIAMLKKQ